MPMAKVYDLIGNLQALYGTWKRKNPDEVEEPPEPSPEYQKVVRRALRLTGKANRS
jgi:hypothetical protein